jgi:hypothetical protein
MKTYNDEAAPWSRSNHPMGTRLLPSGDDRDNNFLRTPPETRTEIMINQATVDLPHPNSPPFKLKAPVRTPQIGQKFTLPLPAACLCHISNLLFLPFTTTGHYLAHWDKWPDLT